MPTNATPVLNIPTRHQKGLVKMFGGIAAPFYATSVVVAEGQPMKFGAAQDEIDPVGDGEGAASCVGLALQETYDESAFGQLKGYHFSNSTRQRLDGSPIGLLTGQGWAMTNFYTGAVAWGNAAYMSIVAGATHGKLKASGVAGDLLPVVFEGAGTDGATMVRIRFNFKIA
jgi:hypothetical protein